MRLIESMGSNNGGSALGEYYLLKAKGYDEIDMLNYHHEKIRKEMEMQREQEQMVKDIAQQIVKEVEKIRKSLS